MANPIETYMRIRLDRFDAVTAKEMHIKFARRKLAEFMARQTVKPMVSIEVDHRSALSEAEVKPYGLIYYRFSRMREIIRYALRHLERLSPTLSGQFRRAWLIMSDSRAIGMDQIGARDEITLVNPEPQARKVHVGARGFEVTRGLVEKVRQLVLRRFGRMVTAGIRFIQLSPGYRLRKAPRAGQMLTYPALVIAPQ